MDNKSRIDELVEKSGEASIKQAPRYIVPTVRLHGNKGIFLRTGFQDSEPVVSEIGDSIKGVMLKVRRSFGSFSKTEQFFTNEHNSWKDKLVLFRRYDTQQGKKTQMVDDGTIKSLREKYPDLRMRQLIYFLLYPKNGKMEDREIVKLTIRGKGLGDLFDYWNNFGSNEHTFQVVTKVGVKEEEGPMGIYYYTSFEKGEEVKGKDFDRVAEAIDEVALKIDETERFYATPPEDKDVENSSSDDDDIPIVDDEDDLKPASTDPNVNIEDIPF